MKTATSDITDTHQEGLAPDPSPTTPPLFPEGAGGGTRLQATAGPGVAGGLHKAFRLRAQLHHALSGGAQEGVRLLQLGLAAGPIGPLGPMCAVEDEQWVYVDAIMRGRTHALTRQHS